MKKIGFIGVGIMGKSMVRNLMKAGFDVAIYTRTKSKVEDVICEGAAWRDSVKECVADRDAVITIVGYPKDVEEVYFGEGGILKNAPTGAYVIDMTTSSPKLAERIYQYSEVNALYLMAGGFDFMVIIEGKTDRKSTRQNSSHGVQSRMPSSA